MAEDRQNSVAADDNDLYGEYLALVQAAKAHLEFYQDLGLTQVGGYQRSTQTEGVQPEQLPVSTTTQAALPVAADPIHATVMATPSLPSEAATAPQTTLFELDETKPKGKPALAQPVRVARIETLADIKAEVGHCCELCPQATQIVFGEGNPQAELMFIGEAPGAEEDAKGRPFVGAAGRLLDKIIEAIGYKRSEVYISNIVKCRPPQNRKPTNDEVFACEPFLFREVDVVKPKMIVTLGATPLFSLLRISQGITRTRGQFYEYNGIPVMPTFHPAYLLREPERKREVWEDMKKVMAKLQEIKQAEQS